MLLGEVGFYDMTAILRTSQRRSVRTQHIQLKKSCRTMKGREYFSPSYIKKKDSTDRVEPLSESFTIPAVFASDHILLFEKGHIKLLEGFSSVTSRVFHRNSHQKKTSGKQRRDC